MPRLKFLCPNCNYEVENEQDEEGNFHCDYCDEDIPEDEILEYEVDDDDDDMPECCSACGCGAYPKCKTSCKIFDE